MNIFENIKIAQEYDAYYITEFGQKVDLIEKELVTTMTKDIPKTKMLELGCGTGHWTEYFLQKGFEVTAIDKSEAMLALAKKKNLKATFTLGDSQNLDFGKDSFSVISSITMLSFVENQDAVIDEMYRVLKPEGWLVIGCLNANSILAKNKEQSETFKDANFLTPKELKQKLAKFGDVKLDFAVYLDDKFTLLDSKSNASIAPVFMLATVQKK